MMNKQNSPGLFLYRENPQKLLENLDIVAYQKRPVLNSLEIFEATADGLSKAETIFFQ